jgi:predicted kinase
MDSLIAEELKKTQRKDEPEYLGVMGPPGSGKSTEIKSLGFHDSDVILLDQDFWRKKIATTIQNDPLFQTLFPPGYVESKQSYFLTYARLGGAFVKRLRFYAFGNSRSMIEENTFKNPIKLMEIRQLSQQFQYQESNVSFTHTQMPLYECLRNVTTLRHRGVPPTELLDSLRSLINTKLIESQFRSTDSPLPEKSFSLQSRIEQTEHLQAG